ncbi:hypothetical protein CVU75_03270 [Candidatus Dependentiae bacterium HGW-Dependentiae-1]|nr:MAG: hypothetical protein CVU75_03270 [Candidatus Dependentiae bacterium HGW-Dependentiae-1]
MNKSLSVSFGILVLCSVACLVRADILPCLVGSLVQKQEQNGSRPDVIKQAVKKEGVQGVYNLLVNMAQREREKISLTSEVVTEVLSVAHWDQEDCFLRLIELGVGTEQEICDVHEYVTDLLPGVRKEYPASLPWFTTCKQLCEQRLPGLTFRAQVVCPPNFWD